MPDRSSTLASTAIVLAGGESRRMGAAKAWLDFGGAPLLVRVVDALLPEFGEVVVVGRTGQKLPACGGRRVNDVRTEGGPLVGMAAGLAAIHSDSAFLTGCDSPFLCLPLIQRLYELRESAMVALPRWDGRLQPLCAVYCRNVLHSAEELLQAGVLRPMALLERVSCRVLEPLEFSDLDPNGLSFLNTNTQTDYRRAISILTSSPRLQSRCPPTDEATFPSL